MKQPRYAALLALWDGNKVVRTVLMRQMTNPEPRLYKQDRKGSRNSIYISLTIDIMQHNNAYLTHGRCTGGTLTLLMTP